jgi:hypothetical protein
MSVGKQKQPSVVHLFVRVRDLVIIVIVVGRRAFRCKAGEVVCGITLLFQCNIPVYSDA